MSIWRSWLFAILIVAALVSIVLHFGELHNFTILIDKAQPGWLAIALVLQLSTYASLALAWRSVLLKAEGRPYRLLPLIRIAFCKLFADQALPTAGMSGNLILVDQLVGLRALQRVLKPLQNSDFPKGCPTPIRWRSVRN